MAAICRRREEPVVIVSNHCSWIDILVHMSHFFPAFVARHGTKNMMLIGLIRCGPFLTLAQGNYPEDACVLQNFTIKPCLMCAARRWDACMWTGKRRKATAARMARYGIRVESLHLLSKCMAESDPSACGHRTL